MLSIDLKQDKQDRLRRQDKKPSKCFWKATFLQINYPAAEGDLAYPVLNQSLTSFDKS